MGPYVCVDVDETEDRDGEWVGSGVERGSRKE
jgi:hypothetical protein